MIFADAVRDNWDDICDLATRHAYWINRGDRDESLAKKRAVLSILLDLDAESIRQINNSEKWSHIQDRLKSLLQLLKLCGLFHSDKGNNRELLYFMKNP